jgi:ElaB/YqjD/DUF883 family membrane-anchored ribosome-binding protein
MDMASVLKGTANFFVAVSVIKLLTRDLKAELRHDGARLRERANGLVRKSPYRAAGVAAAAGAMTGILLAHRRP